MVNWINKHVKFKCQYIHFIALTTWYWRRLLNNWIENLKRWLIVCILFRKWCYRSNLWHKYKRRGDNGIHRSCPLLTLTYDIVLLSLRVHTSGFWCKCYFSCLVIGTHYAIGEFFKEKELRTTVVSYYCIAFIVLGDGVIYWAIIAHSLLFCSLPRFFLK